MLEVRNLSAGYARRAVLDDVCLSVQRGTLTSLIGVNGCGKSTLIKTLAGIQPALGGMITLDGTPLSAISPRERALRIAYLPQERAIPSLTALQLVLHGRFPHLHAPRRYRAMDIEIAQDALSRVGASACAPCDMTRLSGGQRQKVYLAMLLAQQTDAVLLDEPTTYLDIACQLDTWALCTQMRDAGKAVVTVTHDVAQAVRYADQLVVLDHGRVCAQGAPAQLLDDGILERVFSLSIIRHGNTDISFERTEILP